MDNNWEKYGKDIRNLVENAISSQNFNQLNKNITISVNEAVNDIQKGIKTAGQAVTDAASRSARFDRGAGQYKQSGQNNPGNQNRPVDNPQKMHSQPENWQKQPPARKWKGQLSPVNNKNDFNPVLYQKNTSVSVGGWVLAVCGYTFSFGLSITILILCAVAFFMDTVPVGIKIALAILAPLLAGSGAMAWKGGSMLSSLKRYRSYISELHGRTYCNIKELSQRSGKSPKYVIKDLQKMITKGWFRQGHLDKDNTCLIVSHDTYREYQILQQQQEEQKRLESKQLEKQQKVQQKVLEDSEMEQVIQEGKSYLQKIRECNDAILEAEISQKISRIEMLVQKIFDRVKENPDSLEDIHKLMEYYLPTTVKLLDAYQQLECQPVQGENISSSKEEIEKTLDTLNLAFEKLLDSLFEDVAWDVSTDISVLYTMLAQEGLTENDFSKKG